MLRASHSRAGGYWQSSAFGGLMQVGPGPDLPVSADLCITTGGLMHVGPGPDLHRLPRSCTALRRSTPWTACRAGARPTQAAEVVHGAPQVNDEDSMSGRGLTYTGCRGMALGSAVYGVATGERIGQIAAEKVVS